jgi:hypothetical protein
MSEEAEKEPHIRVTVIRPQYQNGKRYRHWMVYFNGWSIGLFAREHLAIGALTIRKVPYAKARALIREAR